jgi:FkbM family methyltransferase
MDLITNPVAVRARDIARRLRLTRILGKLMAGRRYEDKFQSSLLAEIRTNDVIWDVGANIGFYTSIFSEKVGRLGAVIAFEPSPENLARLRTKTQGLENVCIIAKALGHRVGFVSFTQSQDTCGVASRVTADGEALGAIRVPMSTGDAIVRDNEAATPDVVKIDTEGFELEVLEGMPRLLATPKLRAVFVEVHFRLLKERNMSGAPAQIVTLLKMAGFQTKWLGSSHLAGFRR